MICVTPGLHLSLIYQAEAIRMTVIPTTTLICTTISDVIGKRVVWIACAVGIGYRHKRSMRLSILTHLAYIANGKKRVILCNNFTGRISVTLLCGICDASYPTKQR